MSKKRKPSIKVIKGGAVTPWCVQVKWPGGKRQFIEGFHTEMIAQDWIDQKAGDWVAVQMGDGR